MTTKPCGIVRACARVGFEDSQPYRSSHATQATTPVLPILDRAEEIAIHAVDPQLLDAIALVLDRNNRWELAISGGSLYLNAAGQSFQSVISP